MKHSIAEIVKKQKEFFDSHQTKDVSFRVWQLKKFKKAILNNQSLILDALKQDMRKPTLEAYFSEIKIIIHEIDFAIKNIHKWSKSKSTGGNPINFPSKNFIYYEPLGLILIIAPWNYPFYCSLIPLVGAIAAGNCALIKPSEFSEHSSKAIHQIISETFAPEYISVIEGDAKISKEILNEKFDHIFFTGSTFVGQKIMEAAAKQLTPISLEIGGKTPCIVDRDIKIQEAAKRIAWGKFFNAGQTCTAPDYILINKKVHLPFIQAIKQSIIDFYGEDPESSEDFARIINKKHFNRLNKLIEPHSLSEENLKFDEKNKMQDSKILLGGNSTSKSLYIAPTILDNVSADAPIMQEEIFGPILPIIQYSKIEEAIDFVNKRPKPLAMYIFTDDEYLQNKILSECSAGGVTINDTLVHASSHYLPFGGVGNSGIGKYHGKYTFELFSNMKSVCKKSFLLGSEIKYPPYAKKFKLIKRIFAIK